MLQNLFRTTRRQFSNLFSKSALTVAVGSILLASSGQIFAQTKTLKIIPHANLAVLDPVWTTAYITRNHGYMVYDTLFGTNTAGKVSPQMVDKYTTSKDGKTWTFTLRAGLAFHDGAPVTADDVIASIKRWSTRDTFGQNYAGFVEKYEAVNASTFTITLKEPYGLMLEAFGKPSSNVPFIMPKRIADTPGTEQIKEVIGSGPFKFAQTDFKPGDKAIYTKNDKYQPRAEPADGTAGGKVVHVDRVEWLFIRDPQTQLNALQAGEVDILEQPAFEQYATLKTKQDIVVHDFQPAGVQYIFRFNHLHAPFNNVKIRQAAMIALGQEQILKTQVGAPGMYRFCKSIYPCGTPFASDNTGIYTGTANPVLAKKMLDEAGYKGEPVVLMRPTDLAAIAKIPLVAKQQLEQAGFKVDMQQMDWGTLVARRAKKDAPGQQGWNAFMTAWVAGDILNPITMAMMNAKGDTGWFGWQNDPLTEELKGKFARSTSDIEKKKFAEQLQLRAIETASYVHLGQYNNPAAVRKGITGMLTGGQVYWNIKKS
jgi:peptide/nickel transport system substrate-binding protein